MGWSVSVLPIFLFVGSKTCYGNNIATRQKRFHMFANKSPAVAAPSSTHETPRHASWWPEMDSSHWDCCPTCGQTLQPGSKDSPAPAAAPAQPEELPWADRRLAERRPAREGARVEIRRWGISAGPDVGEELIDVSEIGIRASMQMAVRRGEQLDVTLWVPGGAWCIRSMGIVCWCVTGIEGKAIAGIRLRRRLTTADFKRLADSGCPVSASPFANGTRPV